MRIVLTGTVFLFAILTASAVAPVQPASAEPHYCPNLAHSGPGTVPLT
jgi:hypothetical protein